MAPQASASNAELFARFEQICHERGLEDPAAAARQLAKQGPRIPSPPPAPHDDVPSPHLAPPEPNLAPPEEDTSPAFMTDPPEAIKMGRHQARMEDLEARLRGAGLDSEDFEEELTQDLTVESWSKLLVILQTEASTHEAEQRAMLQPRPARLEAMSTAQSREVQAASEEAEHESKRWSQNVWSGLGRLRKRVVALRQNSATAEPEHLQAVARGLERDLEVFKAQQRQDFQSMGLVEPELEDSLETMGRRFESWVAEPSFFLRPGFPDASPSAASRSPSRRSRPAESPAPPSTGETPRKLQQLVKDDAELQELKVELESLGPEADPGSGGWSAYEHDVFVRILRSFKMEATPQFYARLQQQFPDYSQAQLADHLRWFSENEAQQARRRYILARWRERRLEIEREVGELNGQNLVEQRRKADEKEQRARAEQRRKVAEWKQSRAEEEQRAALLQQSREQEQARLEKQKQKQQLKQLKETREAAEAYRRLREADRLQAERSRARARSASNRSLSQEDRQRIAQRNLELLHKKLEAQPQPKRAPQPRSRAYDHVASRLYGQTESFVQKITNKVDDAGHASTAPAHAEDLPRFNQRSSSLGPPQRVPQGAGWGYAASGPSAAGGGRPPLGRRMA
mmetsp:Transcript_43692/g.78441  ORF Transcript_43692/g.78441 Transcript_43692/m.78441 type:complete len:630 (-) Transcript_43692:89-1978(-)